MLLDKPIPFIIFLRKIRREALLIFLFANAVVLAKFTLHLWELTIPIAIPTLLGTCISLLLAFRTNQAYERWWEARIAWGGIVNDSRSFVRQLLMFVRDSPFKDHCVRELVNRHCAWCYVLGDALRGLDVTERLRAFLPPDEADEIARADNKPNALLLAQGLTIRKLYEEGELTDFQMIQLSTTLVSLTDSMGRCERIKNTVFPRTYSFNLRLFIYLFATLLPFCFDADLFYLDVPLVTLISSAFILIEKSAIQIQDPFENRPTDTSMTSIAQTIEINLKQMAQYDSVPSKQVADTYYVM